MNGQLEDILRASAEMAELQRVAPRLTRLKNVDLVKAKPTASTFTAQSDATRVFIKLYHGPDAPQIAKSAAQALMTLNRALPEGPTRVHEFLELLPKRGILITRFVDGPTMSMLCSDAAPDILKSVLRMAAEWLSTFSSTHKADGPFRGDFWLRTARRNADTLDLGPHRALAGKLLDRIYRLNAAIETRSLRRVRCHGDFAPQNLIFADDAVYGVDIQSLQTAPPERDIARMLTRLVAENDFRAYPTRYGFSEALITPFRALLDHAEQANGEDVLEFFLAINFLERLARTKDSPKRGPKAALDAAAFLADPRKPRES